MEKKVIILLAVLMGIMIAQAASISGMVTVANGEPVSGDLFLYPGQNAMNPIMQTPFQAGSVYTLANLMPGMYILQVIPYSNQYQPLFYPGVATPEEAEILELANMQTNLTEIDFYLEGIEPEEHGLLAGILVDETAAGIAGHGIYLYGIWNSYWNSYHSETDAAGNFEISEIVPGDYILFVEHLAGYQHYFWENAHNYLGADVVHFNSGESITGLVLEMSPLPSFSISGTVRQRVAEEEFPLSEALISGYAINCWGSGEYFQTISDEYGHYSAQVSSGMYWLFSSKNGYQEQYWENAASFEEATPLHINQNLSDKDFLLESLTEPDNNSISGFITLDGDEPGFPCLVIVVASDEDDDWSDTALSESSGYYFLDEIPAGEYYIVMLTSTTPPVYYPVGYDWEEAEAVYIEGNLTGIDFAIQNPSQDGVLIAEGNVTKPDSSPVAGAVVIFFDENDFPVSYGITNANGQYLASALSTGMYSALATKTHYDGVTVELSISESSDLDFIITPANTSSEPESIPPVSTSLLCYPNPFVTGSARSGVQISFSPAQAGAMRLSVFNLKGQLVKNIHTGWLAAEPVIFHWDGMGSSAASSGVYLLALENDGVIIAKEKILLLK